MVRWVKEDAPYALFYSVEGGSETRGIGKDDMNETYLPILDNDPRVVRVTYNPAKYTYFVDRDRHRAITKAERVYLLGDDVFAWDPTFDLFIDPKV
jgi:hypothetical protein